MSEQVNRAGEECHRCHMSGMESNTIVDLNTGEEKGHLWKCDNCDMGHLFHDEGEFVPVTKDN